MFICDDTTHFWVPQKCRLLLHWLSVLLPQWVPWIRLQMRIRTEMPKWMFQSGARALQMSTCLCLTLSGVLSDGGEPISVVVAMITGILPCLPFWSAGTSLTCHCFVLVPLSDLRLEFVRLWWDLLGARAVLGSLRRVSVASEKTECSNQLYTQRCGKTLILTSFLVPKFTFCFNNYTLHTAAFSWNVQKKKGIVHWAAQLHVPRCFFPPWLAIGTPSTGRDKAVKVGRSKAISSL